MAGLNDRSGESWRFPRAAANPAKDRADDGAGKGQRLAEAQRARAAREDILSALDDAKRRQRVADRLRALLRTARDGGDRR